MLTFDIAGEGTYALIVLLYFLGMGPPPPQAFVLLFLNNCVEGR